MFQSLEAGEVGRTTLGWAEIDPERREWGRYHQKAVLAAADSYARLAVQDVTVLQGYGWHEAGSGCRDVANIR